MADDVQRRIIYLEVNATKGIEGSAALTKALLDVDKGSSVAGSSLASLEAANVAAGGAAQRAAADITRSMGMLDGAYRSAASGALALAKASTEALQTAAGQADGFAKLAQQRAADTAKAQSRELIASVQQSNGAIAQLYGTVEKTQVQSTRNMTAQTLAFASAQTKVAAEAKQAADAVEKVNKLTPNQRLMLSYQLNDVFTTLVGGMNPLMIAAQQGPQITQIFGGLRNTIAAIPKPLLVGGAAALGGVVSVAALNAIAKMNDELEEQQRRFTTLTGSRDQADSLYKDVAKFASDAGISIAAATASTVDFAKATSRLGATRQNVVDITTMAEKLTQLSGASAEEGGAAKGALSSMLKDSTVNAAQLGTVLSSVPQIADKIAAGLGVSVTQLKLMAVQGDLNNKQVFDALLTQSAAVNAEFDRMPKSIGSLFQSLGDDLLQVLQRFANLIPLVQQYRLAIELAARAAKALNQATTPATPAQRMAAAGGDPGIYSDSTNRLFRGSKNPSAYYSALYDLGTSENSQTFAELAAQTKAVNDNLIEAATLAEKLDPVKAKLQDIQRQTDIVEKALADLMAGKVAGLSSEQTAETIDALTDALRRLHNEAQNAGDAGDQALKQIGIAADQSRRLLTPGQKDLENRTRSLTDQNVPQDRASAIANAEMLQSARDYVTVLEAEANAEELKTQAMRGGKQAMIDAAVAAALLAWQMKNVAASTEETQVAFDVISERIGNAFKKIEVNKALQAGIDASKPLLIELAGIAAAMKVVEDGAYAMRRAEAEAKAARAENGTGGLQMQVFDQRQALTDAANMANLQKEIDLTNALAAAAGDVAKQKQIQLDYDIKRAQQEAGPGAAGLIAEKMRAKAVADRNLLVAEGAVDLEKQVTLVRQETAAIQSGSADYMAQLAMLEKKRDLIRQGVDVENDANAQRQITAAGDLARAQQQKQLVQDAADATKRTWMNAYDNIQSAGADTFYSIFTNAGVKASDVAQTIRNIFLRAFAEIAAAAIIRPIIAPIFQGASSLGLIPSGAVPAATGVMPAVGGATSSLGSVGGSSGLSGGGGLSFGGTSSLGGGGMFGSLSTWMNTPFTGGMAGVSPLPAGVMGPAPNTAVGGLGSNGFTMGGLTPGNVIGGGLSIGMGALTLANANGNTGKTIGGIGQMIGGGLMMIPTPWTMAAGAVISMISSFLPGLFGDGPKIPPQPALVYSAGGFYDNGTTTGFGTYGDSLNGGSPLGRQAAGMGTQLLSLFSSNNLKAVAGGMYGGELAAGTDHVLNGQQWQDRPYTQTALTLPGGGIERLTYNDSSRDPQAAADYLLANVFKANVLRGGVTGASDALKTALTNTDLQSKDDLTNLLALTNAYDKLGKATNPVKDALDKLNQTMADMSVQATTYGLSLEPIQAELAKVTKRTAQDFIDTMLDPLQVQLRALADERESALTSAQYIKDNVEGVYVDMAQVAAYYTKKEADLRNQFYGGAVDSLQAAIDRIKPGGDLANLDPTGTLAGLKATYDSTLAQAMANDPTAIANLANAGTNYLDYYKSYSGGSSQYTAIRDSVLEAFQQVQAAIQAPANSNGSTLDTNNPALAQITQQTQQLMATVKTLTDALEAEREDNAALHNLLSRYLTNRAA